VIVDGALQNECPQLSRSEVLGMTCRRADAVSPEWARYLGSPPVLRPPPASPYPNPRVSRGTKVTHSRFIDMERPDFAPTCAAILDRLAQRFLIPPLSLVPSPYARTRVKPFARTTRVAPPNSMRLNVEIRVQLSGPGSSFCCGAKCDHENDRVELFLEKHLGQNQFKATLNCRPCKLAGTNLKWIPLLSVESKKLELLPTEASALAREEAELLRDFPDLHERTGTAPPAPPAPPPTQLVAASPTGSAAAGSTSRLDALIPIENPKRPRGL
jgi:hypothetical protein